MGQSESTEPTLNLTTFIGSSTKPITIWRLLILLWSYYKKTSTFFHRIIYSKKNPCHLCLNLNTEMLILNINLVFKFYVLVHDGNKIYFRFQLSLCRFDMEKYGIILPQLFFKHIEMTHKLFVFKLSICSLCLTNIKC
jgi:hypothetical protein